MRYEDGKRLPTVTKKSILGFFEEYRWLSNFHLCDIVIDGIVYPSAEHAFMAMKTQSEVLRLRVSAAHSPRTAKQMGRGLKLRDGWDAKLRVPAMRIVSWHKYTQHTDLRRKLIATGDRYLEETNDWGDRFWGVDETGANHLGHVLMDTRRDLQILETL